MLFRLFSLNLESNSINVIRTLSSVFGISLISILSKFIRNLPEILFSRN